MPPSPVDLTMGKFFAALTPAHREFIAAQHVFFVATAPGSGRVNLSPKGLDTFRVLTAGRVGYLDLTGSGNETAAHVRENGRVTFMFCALAGDPLILRIYGRGRIVRPRHAEWAELRPLFGAPQSGERQLLIADIESVQTSCGFGVPCYDYAGDRTRMAEWAQRKGEAGVAAYWAEKNTRSIDGLPSGILDP